MRALSVRPPWWWAILHLGKDIENRSWPTKFRGRILLHASKWWVFRHICDDLDFIEQIAPNSMKLDFATKHPHTFLKSFGGCIMGSVEIVDCVTVSPSPWFTGPYGLVLRHPIAFTVPVAYKGALGLFKVNESCIPSAELLNLQANGQEDRAMPVSIQI